MTILKIDIIPASLACSEDELKQQLERITPLNKVIHLDYADGQFVENNTVDWQILYDLPEFYHDNQFELHLMAKDPLELAQEASLRGFTKIIFPAEEIKPDEVTIVENISNDCEVYLSLNPNSGVNILTPFLPWLSGVVLMGVEPGEQGREFDKNVLAKISELSIDEREFKIEIDGGVNLDTIDSILEYPVNELVVGSALIKAESPRETLEKLQEKVGKNANQSI